MESRFFVCEVCGNMITMIKDSGNSIRCCGKSMKELVPEVDEVFEEKHVPVFEIDGNKVTVRIGSKPHPSTQDHFIQWICIQTSSGMQLKPLTAGPPPVAEFTLCDDEKLLAVYALCNLHGLWKADACKKLNT